MNTQSLTHFTYVINAVYCLYVLSGIISITEVSHSFVMMHNSQRWSWENLWCLEVLTNVTTFCEKAVLTSTVSLTWQIAALCLNVTSKEEPSYLSLPRFSDSAKSCRTDRTLHWGTQSSEANSQPTYLLCFSCISCLRLLFFLVCRCRMVHVGAHAYINVG